MKRCKGSKFLTYFLLVLILSFTSFPLFSMLGNAFKANDELLFDTNLFAKNPTLDNFRYVIERTNFTKYIGNSLIIGAVVTLICLIVAGFSAYALSRFRGRGFTFFKLMTYAFQMLPIVLLLVPLFMIIKALGLFDSIWAVIVCYTAISLPLAIWVLKGYFDTVSVEIEESAHIDGCGRLGTFLRIVVPVSLPGIASAGVLTFNYTWNEYMLSNLFINNDDYRTITAGLATFVEHNATQWGYMMAGAVLGTIPAILILIFAQKYVVQGLSSGAVKG